MQVFFCDDDYRSYALVLAGQARRHQLDIWAYCLMPNHVHLIAVPATEQGLAGPLGEAHRRYALSINQRHGWKGHLWQERFSSFPMDEVYLRAAIRYVLLNPVRAGLADTATGWPYSSAKAQVTGESDLLVNCRPSSDRVDDWVAYLEPTAEIEQKDEIFRRQSRIGRPLGSKRFVAELERITGRRLRPRKVGRKPKAK